MLHTKLLAVVASLASAVVVRDAAEFRAELASGAPSIELADDLYLEGEELNVTAPCVVDGRGYVLHNDARHFRASASLDLRNVALVCAGYAPTPSPTCAPTPVVEEEPVDPLELVDIFNAGVDTCDDTNKLPTRSVAGGGVLAVDLAGDGCKVTRVLDADGAGVAELPLLAQQLYAEDSGAVLVLGGKDAQEKNRLTIVAPDGSVSPSYRYDKTRRDLQRLATLDAEGGLIAELTKTTGTISLLRATGGALNVTSQLDLRAQFPEIREAKGLYYDGFSLYVVGRTRSDRHLARVDVVDGGLNVTWVAPIATRGGEPYVLFRRASTDEPAAEVLLLSTKFYARVDAQSSEVLALQERPDWDDALVDVWSYGSFAYDPTRDRLYSVSPERLGRHDVDTLETDWTVAYGTAFDGIGALGAPTQADVHAMADGTLRLVLLAADGATHVATLRGDEPSGAGVPTMAPTTCERGRRHPDGDPAAATGCVLVEGGLVATGVSFSGCASDGDGGAVFAMGSKVVLTACSFDECTASGSGGAVAVHGGTLDVVDSTFTNVRADGGGGAVWAERASLTLRGTNFTDAAANLGGGAVANIEGAALLVTECLFLRCVVLGDNKEDGGGIYAKGARNATNKQRGGVQIADITNSLFEDCAADKGAALWLESMSRATIEGCHFYRNGGVTMTGKEKFSFGIIDIRKLDDFLFIRNEMMHNIARRRNLEIGQVTNVEIVGSNFSYNSGQLIRAYQLFEGETLIQGSHFLHNLFVPEKDPEGLNFFKESPRHHVRIESSQFVNSTVLGSSAYGVALNLKVDTSIYDCVFESNSASVGGAVYIGTVSSLNVSATDFVKNAANVGGAIAACSKSQDNTCSGTYTFSSFRATANRARTADGEKSGGGFANINGGSTTVRNVTLAGNGADELGSALNLRYAEAWFYTVQAPSQTMYLSQNGQLDAYCSPGLQLVVSDTGRDEWVVNGEESLSGANITDPNAGSYAEECSLCPPGSDWSGEPDFACVACPSGRFKAPGDSSCKKCRGNHVQPSEGKASCNKCSKDRRANSKKTRCIDNTPKWMDELLIAIGVILGVGLLVYLGMRWRSLAKKKRKLQAERMLIVSEQVTAARERVQEFQAHFVTVPGSVFVGFDRLRPQEELRDEIIVYDSVADVRDASTRGEVFIFFSHQWLGWAEPDPERIHLAAMQQAVQSVSKDTDTPLEKIRVWVDYISIPQKNRSVQKTAIASLPTFASCCDYFIVIAPDATHKNTGALCGSRSYRSRAWCRAEIMSCWARRGTSAMYYNTNDGLRPLVVSDDEILHEALDVMHGEFTCCRLGHPDEEPCDREALMLPLLGLYADVYAQRNGKVGSKSRLDQSRTDAYKFIEPLKDTLFPATFEYAHRSSDGVETTTTQVLFGDLIAAVEESIDGVDADNMSRHFQPGTNARRHRLHHAKHGHASGGLGKLMRRHSSHGLKRSGSTLQRSGSTASRSDEENVQAHAGRRPQLNRSATWRTSAPSVEM